MSKKEDTSGVLTKELIEEAYNKLKSFVIREQNVPVIHIIPYGVINGNVYNKGDFERELEIVSTPLYTKLNGKPVIRIFGYE